jgi:L-seryl-tRNA(Ser) seleniumtransferase
MTKHATSRDSILRAIPSVDQLLRNESVAALRESIGLSRLTAIAREVTDELRNQIQTEGTIEKSEAAVLDEALRRIQAICERESKSAIRHVINATGVILHTNLGRALLSDPARQAIQEAAGYCTVEYDPALGQRGKRGARVEELLCQLTGAEAALVVNNCAAAALLILTVLAGDGETLVSRGELVEIGGDFRVPDVMANSGTRMVEVGTTNRTRVDDYERALTENTRLIMRVHPSNYRIVGFTQSPKLAELSTLAHQHDLVMYEDAGSGVLADLFSAVGLIDEPIISDSLKAQADVVSFSGDKLLGATQAGLIVGKREIVERLRKHPLYRALRVDKLSLAALEATLEAHRRGAIEEIPALRMLAMRPDEIELRARAFAEKLNSSNTEIEVSLVVGQSAVGGGSGPTTQLPTTLISLKHPRLTADQIEESLRLNTIPVIARIADDRVLLDLRTVAAPEEAEMLKAVLSLAK